MLSVTVAASISKKAEKTTSSDACDHSLHFGCRASVILAVMGVLAEDADTEDHETLNRLQVDLLDVLTLLKQLEEFEIPYTTAAKDD